MRRVFGSLLDPTVQNVDLGRRQSIARLPGRHAHRVVLLGDPHDQFAGFRIAGNNRRFAVLERFDGRFATVEPQPLGSLRLILAMAGKAVPGQDRPNFAVVVDLARKFDLCFGTNRQAKADRQDQSEHKHVVRSP